MSIDVDRCNGSWERWYLITRGLNTMGFGLSDHIQQIIDEYNRRYTYIYMYVHMYIHRYICTYIHVCILYCEDVMTHGSCKTSSPEVLHSGFGGLSEHIQQMIDKYSIPTQYNIYILMYICIYAYYICTYIHTYVCACVKHYEDYLYFT